MSELTTSLAVDGEPTLSHGARLTMTISNPTKTTQKFCAYHTPFEGIRSEFLEVLDHKGVAVQYRGELARRSPPTEKDWKSVAPGASIRASFELKAIYTLAAATYTVRFRGSAVNGLKDTPAISITVAP